MNGFDKLSLWVKGGLLLEVRTFDLSLYLQHKAEVRELHHLDCALVSLCDSLAAERRRAWLTRQMVAMFFIYGQLWSVWAQIWGINCLNFTTI